MSIYKGTTQVAGLPTGLIDTVNGKVDLDMSNITSNAGTALNNVGVRTVVEVSNKSLMPSWYRVYSDGWCEQGGYVSSVSYIGTQVSFLKEFKDTNYNVSNKTLFDSTNAGSGSCGNKTTTSMTLRLLGYNINSGAYSSSITLSCNWQASGYIE